MTAPSPNRVYQQLRSHLAYLKLDAAADALATELDSADGRSHVEVLERLLAIEVEATSTRRRESRRRLAGLPATYRIDDFDFDAQPGVDADLIRDLATMRFVDHAGNILFIGPPGVGKTMLAVGLGHAAIDAGHRVYYTTAADLVARCHRAAIQGRWANTMRFFAAPQLLIIDELGCAPRGADVACGDERAPPLVLAGTGRS